MQRDHCAQGFASSKSISHGIRLRCELDDEIRLAATPKMSRCAALKIDPSRMRPIVQSGNWVYLAHKRNEDGQASTSNHQQTRLSPFQASYHPEHLGQVALRSKELDP
jgi:hypothetical protein